jgi:hypothetical protein
MLTQLTHVRLYTLLTGLMVALASTFLACEFGSPVPVPQTPKELLEILNKAPIIPLSEGDRWTVFEEPGRIRVQHGYGCAEAGKTSKDSLIGFRIQDQEVAPNIDDRGAIFLNGWDMQYPNGDHHVLGLGSLIFNISRAKDTPGLTLEWEAGGVLSDKDGADGYQWCYRYTLIFWNPNVIDASAFQFDENTTFMSKDSPSGSGVGEIEGTFAAPDEKDSPRAVLPRGLGQLWRDGDDHHVLQVAFDLGTPPLADIIVPNGNTLTWTSETILVDNGGAHTHMQAEIVTILSGQSVEMWQPRSVLHLIGAKMVEEPTEMILEPAEDGGITCNGNGEEQQEEFYVVERVPYDYAIPVLTGWDMQYACEDHEIERIGVYMVEFHYDKDPNAATGTLHYTIFSTMRDDSNNGHYLPRYKVSVLGFNELGGGSDK